MKFSSFPTWSDLRTESPSSASGLNTSGENLLRQILPRAMVAVMASQDTIEELTQAGLGGFYDSVSNSGLFSVTILVPSGFLGTSRRRPSKISCFR
jgi:hypothetical protein